MDILMTFNTAFIEVMMLNTQPGTFVNDIKNIDNVIIKICSNVLVVLSDSLAVVRTGVVIVSFFI